MQLAGDIEGPLRRPQEALGQCQLQMGGQDWEGVMTGLKTLRRLTKHHPEVVAASLHSIIMDVTRHVHNLRSQVSRTACSVAGELAVALHRRLDNELEELVAPLLHRSADTNRFLREDCGKALDRIMEHTLPSRSIPAIISQGASHKNKIVRATTARLLAEIVMRLGPDKILGAASPGAGSAGGITREVRGRLLKTVAALLTEGSLETRTHAKKTFEVLMVHDAFESCLEQSVQPSLMRSIQKTMLTLRRAYETR
ncbi:hypothetical protein B566_EDAN018201 [Ephemera danica]|nr:hypothetical protein B566_EDAN018201 [Ephemera danica]